MKSDKKVRRFGSLGDLVDDIVAKYDAQALKSAVVVMVSPSGLIEVIAADRDGEIDPLQVIGILEAAKMVIAEDVLGGAGAE